MEPSGSSTAQVPPNTTCEPDWERVKANAKGFSNKNTPLPKFLQDGHWYIPPWPLFSQKVDQSLASLGASLQAPIEFWWKPELQYLVSLKCPKCKGKSIAPEPTSIQHINRKNAF